ncbi:MAG: helix-turn-helix transcriptional regulator [Pseudomonas sp.]|uniref:helix-turn-helix transcriptional regulator n=1 Tax=Pseudomonas abieticivorans TaxID=2931382 RepID=UPI0020C153A4|nr:helix-turn-helix transcriptional regulator [Pseudomonas sp. PIA16]MDE1166670.1 helix-turn-helix transcriptional regulator [Pseudomonas sp.]
MKTTLLNQIRERRLGLGLKIQDMPLLAGLTRQQYGKIEAGGNPRLATLDQIAEGLDSALLLVPKEKLEAVARVLAANPQKEAIRSQGRVLAGEHDDAANAEDENPWGNI